MPFLKEKLSLSFCKLSFLFYKKTWNLPGHFQLKLLPILILILNELRGFGPGKTLTGLLKYRSKVENTEILRL